MVPPPSEGLIEEQIHHIHWGFSWSPVCYWKKICKESMFAELKPPRVWSGFCFQKPAAPGQWQRCFIVLELGMMVSIYNSPTLTCSLNYYFSFFLIYLFFLHRHTLNSYKLQNNVLFFFYFVIFRAIFEIRFFLYPKSAVGSLHLLQATCFM